MKVDHPLKSGVPGLMPGGPLLRECHGGITSAKDFCNSVQEFGELLQLARGEITAELWVEAPACFDFFARHARHHADEFNFLPSRLF